MFLLPERIDIYQTLQSVYADIFAEMLLALASCHAIFATMTFTISGCSD